MTVHQFARLGGHAGAGFNGGSHAADVAADDRSNQTSANSDPLHNLDVCGFHHGVRGSHQADQALRFYQSNRAHNAVLPRVRMPEPKLGGLPRVREVGGSQIDLGIEKFLLWNDGVHDVLHLRPGEGRLLFVGVRCNQIHIQPQRPGQIAFGVVGRIRCRILSASVCRFWLVSHVRFSFQERDSLYQQHLMSIRRVFTFSLFGKGAVTTTVDKNKKTDVAEHP